VLLFVVELVFFVWFLLGRFCCLSVWLVSKVVGGVFCFVVVVCFVFVCYFELAGGRAGVIFFLFGVVFLGMCWWIFGLVF